MNRRQDLNRHAYCVLAHNEPMLLATLFALIDDERNDVYLMIDKKQDIRLFDGIMPRKAGFLLAPRIKANWGAISLVEAEFSVLQTAHDHGPYAYYHLISGVDLPLHCQDWIHRFFDENQGSEFFDISPLSSSHAWDCVNYHHVFLEYMRLKKALLRKPFSFARRLVIAAERFCGYHRQYPCELKKGSQWFSITEEACEFLLSKHKDIKKHFNHILTADEIVPHSLFATSRFYKNIYNYNGSTNWNGRLIQWEDGSPHVWTMSDIGRLCASKCIFARKFSSAHMDVIHALSKHIQKEAESM